MSAETTPRGLRAIISIVGRCNAGKSSLINALCGQQVAIVSSQLGTTTDAVAKPYELLPLGPVTFYDTAGIDDESNLGEQRIKASKNVLAKSDVTLVVVGKEGLQSADYDIITQIQKMRIPFVVVFNKTDICLPKDEDKFWLKNQGYSYVEVSAETGANITELKNIIINMVPKELKQEQLLAGDLFKRGDIVVLVTPIDYSAPKGRLILPQVQVLREVLDKGAKGIVVQEDELVSLLNDLKTVPALIIADSKVIRNVAALIPEEVPLTTFSVLFARNKGDIKIMYDGALAIDNLRNGNKILIAEACSHHVQDDDIGRVKIPNMLKKYTGKSLEFDFCQGTDFPDDIEQYALVVHCGACMINRAEMLHRLKECTRRGVKISNYGTVISKTQGLLDRVLKPLGLI